jgi:hypothetical protein
VTRLGLIAEPDEAGELADDLAEELPPRLDRSVQERAPWEVEVRRAPEADRHDTAGVVEAAKRLMDEHGWDLAICLTDLPLHRDGRPLVADVSARDGVALLSLPALAGLLVHRRARDAIVRLAAQLVTEDAPSAGEDPSLLGGPAPHVAVTPSDDVVDARVVATPVRGRVRLLAGMVAANRPWRLVVGLSSALAAALATSAFGLITVTVWMLATNLGPARLTLATVASVIMMVAWLILDQHLWERAGEHGLTRERAAFYNASTVITLAIGVGLFSLDFVVATFVIDSGVFAQQVGHHVDVGDYLSVAWLTASAATVGGALGSSLESEEAVRRAAYGRRQRQRLEALEQDDGS